MPRKRSEGLQPGTRRGVKIASVCGRKKAVKSESLKEGFAVEG
jgi:hypothetical protein